MMNVVNKRKFGCDLYEAHYLKQAFLVYAKSKNDALQKAVEYLRVKARDRSNINIHKLNE